MPIRYRKRMPRRRRVLRRRFRKSRITRPLPRSVYSFKQSSELSNIGVTTTSPFIGFAYQFQLSDLGQSGTFAALYDQYRLCAVKITFYPQVNVYSTSNQSTSTNAPVIYTVIDYDDGTVPANTTTLDQYQSLKRKMLTRPHSRYLKPQAIGICLNAGGAVSGEYNIRRPWCNIAQTGIPHYGVKGAIITTSSGDTVEQLIRVCVTYYFQCRHVR